MELMQIMKRVELFRGLNNEQLQRLSDISREEIYNANVPIFEQGAIGDRMYIVSKGQVEVRVRDRSGQSRAALYLGEGQVFGEMALVDNGRRSATLVAVDDNTVVYSIPSEEFTTLCRTDTAIGYVMMRNIAQDLSFKLRHHDFDPTKS
jgi:CRP/FNR family transcriptional regulator, cyclic AMP receptor protein